MKEKNVKNKKNHLYLKLGFEKNVSCEFIKLLITLVEVRFFWVTKDRRFKKDKKIKEKKIIHFE